MDFLISGNGYRPQFDHAAIFVYGTEEKSRYQKN